jgi:hypothetical protein
MCPAFSKHFSIRDGSIPINIASTDIHAEVCTNGGQITSSSAQSSEDDTGPGDAAGFVVSVKAPYRTQFNSGGFTGGGASNEFVLNRRVFRYTWTTACTNAVCAVRLK